MQLARTDPDGFAAEVRAEQPGWDERDVAAVVADVAECRIEPLIGAIERGFATSDPAYELLARIQVPVLLVLAREEASVITGDDRARAVAALPPGSRVVELDSGHVVHRDQPDVYLAAALEWLAG